MNLPARQQFLGLGFDPLDQSQTLDQIKRLARSDSFSFVVTPNVDHMVRLHSLDPVDTLWRIYRTADICVCDSQILQALSKASDVPLPLVTGSDLTDRLVRDMARNDGGIDAKIAIIGGDAELKAALQKTYPAINWQQTIPPMGVAKNLAAQAQISEFVEKSAAIVFLLAIGSPQSEMVCDLIKQRGKARGVALCIGASLEFMVGTKQRAPKWMQALKIEWLFRLLSEPGRLWKRYLVQGPKIFTIWQNWHKNNRLAD